MTASSNCNEIINRFKSNSQTLADERLISKFCYPGEPDFKLGIERFKKHHQKEKQGQLDMFFDNGMMIPFKDSDSAIPKQMMRGSLFSPITRGRRKLIQNKIVATSKFCEIRYTGAQLDQNDLDVLLRINKLLSKFSQCGNVESITNKKTGKIQYSAIKFTRYSLLKSLGRTDGKKSYEALEYSLDRLQGSLKVIINGTGRFSGGILGKTSILDNGMIEVTVNHDYTKLFTDGNFSFIDMESRLKLKGDFAKWLQGFISTHTGESKYSADKLMELSGSTMKRARDFKRLSAEPAFKQLKSIGLIKYYSINKLVFTWYR